MTLLGLSANDIDIAGQDFDADLPVSWLAAELSDASLTAELPGHVHGRLSRSGEDIVVRGRLKADLSTPCARCLAPTPIYVDTELSLLLKPAPGAPHPGHEKKANGKPHAGKGKDLEPEYEFSAAEADVDHYDGETVVLDPFLREAILLEIPNFPLCSEACPGIRPASSEDESRPRIDPRLAPLNALREKLAAKGPSGPPLPANSKTKKNPKE